MKELARLKQGITTGSDGAVVAPGCELTTDESSCVLCAKWKTVESRKISNGTPASSTLQSLWTGCGSSSMPPCERVTYTCGT
jgi:hypothetical protein